MEGRSSCGIIVILTGFEEVSVCMSATPSPSTPAVTDISQLDERVEHELLVLCSRTTLDDAHVARIESLIEAGGVHWGHLVTTAGYHGVQGLLYSALRSVDAELLSQEHMEWLRGKVGARSAHSLVLIQVLGGLAGLFGRE